MICLPHPSREAGVSAADMHDRGSGPVFNGFSRSQGMIRGRLVDSTGK